MRRSPFACFAALLLTGCLHGQSFTTSPCSADESETGSNGWFFGHANNLCELRRTTLPLLNGRLRLEGRNGGIQVIGEDRRDVDLEASVIVQDSNHDRAMSLAREIKIVTNGTIHAEGPHESGLFGHSWSVNYRLHVPHHLAAQLSTENGSITLEDIEGTIGASTTNGALTLQGLAGDVRASTVNGGLDVSLEGPQWRGGGLLAESTNGGVSIFAPDRYSAHLIASTVNGGISVAFPVTVQGPIRNHLDTNIGNGGATLEFHTVNGGVSVRHGSNRKAQRQE